MRKTSVRIAFTAIMVVALGVLFSGIADAKSAAKPKPKAKKVTVCHYRGNAKYRMLTIAESALPAHLKHGDVLPGSVVGDNYVEDNCSVVATNRVESGPQAVIPGGWAYVTCPAETPVAISGGYEMVDDTPDDDVTPEDPGLTPSQLSVSGTTYGGYTFIDPITGWVVYNSSGADVSITVYAICVP